MAKTYTAMADCRLCKRRNVQFWKGKLTFQLRRTSVHRNYYKSPVKQRKKSPNLLALEIGVRGNKSHFSTHTL